MDYYKCWLVSNLCIRVDIDIYNIIKNLFCTKIIKEPLFDIIRYSPFQEYKFDDIIYRADACNFYSEYKLSYTYVKIKNKQIKKIHYIYITDDIKQCLVKIDFNAYTNIKIYDIIITSIDVDDINYPHHLITTIQEFKNIDNCNCIIPGNVIFII